MTTNAVTRASANLSEQALLEMFWTMLLSRRLDERAWALHRQGKIAFHISAMGHEAAQVGAAYAINRGVDYVHPYYRDLALVLALGITPTDFMMSLMGKKGEYSSGGRQMSSHFGYKPLNIVSGSAPVATQVPQAAGLHSVGTIRAMREGQLKVFFALGGNFLSAAPDTEFVYSDVNYVVLAAVIEGATGHPAYAVIRRLLLQPVGLGDIVPADTVRIEHLAIADGQRVVAALSQHRLDDPLRLRRCQPALAGAHHTGEPDGQVGIDRRFPSDLEVPGGGQALDVGPVLPQVGRVDRQRALQHPEQLRPRQTSEGILSTARFERP